MAEARVPRSAVQHACDRLVGECCWLVSAGAGTGSVLNLGFGRKLRRSVPLTNPKLPQEARENDAEYSLFIESVWRLDQGDRVVCGAWDDNRADGPMLRGLARLSGRTVVAVRARQPGLDLELDFENGLRLTVFCDRVNEDEGDDNYSVFTTEEVLTVGPRSALRSEPAIERQSDNE